jgi:two-component system, chemotaxis family, chemotaxis protein CheY
MKNILIIDDEASARRVLLRAVNLFGYHGVDVDQAGNVLALCEELQPSAVVTDIFMPDQDGLELIRSVRKKWPELPIIAMSGGGNIGNLDVLRAAKAMGAVQVLTKPFDFEELKKCLAEVCGGPGEEA